MIVTSMNVTGSNIDPSCLPSTIMGTIGAIYAIFIAVSIFSFQTLTSKELEIINKLNSSNKDPYYSKKFVNSLIFFFELLTFFVLITEIVNGIFLLTLIFDPDYTTVTTDIYKILSLVSFSSFLVTLLYICVISNKLIDIFTKTLNNNYEFDDVINFYSQLKSHLSLLSRHSLSYIGLLVNLGILGLFIYFGLFIEANL